MLGDKAAVATIAVKDIDVAKKFYEGTLGLRPTPDQEEGALSYQTAKGAIFVYPSDYAGTNQATALTWIVDDVESEVKDLKAKGVDFRALRLPPGHEGRGRSARLQRQEARVVQGSGRKHPRDRRHVRGTMTNLIAKATTIIDAPTEIVWDALVTPSIIKEYMFGTNVVSDWKEGSPIAWKGEWEGKAYEDKGVIQKIVPHRLLQYTHSSRGLRNGEFTPSRSSWRRRASQTEVTLVAGQQRDRGGARALGEELADDARRVEEVAGTVD